MSCIPGSIGGGIRMNLAVLKEFKDVVSIQLVDFKWSCKSIPANKINFNYRAIELSKNLIFFECYFCERKKTAQK